MQKLIAGRTGQKADKSEIKESVENAPFYGIMSYTVATRTREIGLRMALGAQRMTVLWLILSESLLVVVVGVLVGVPASLFASRILSAVLFGVTATDAGSLVIVILILGAVALLASYIPARRAAKLDPSIASRID